MVPLGFYSSDPLLAMHSAVLATVIPSVRLSDCPLHADTLSRRMNIGLRGFYSELAKIL